MSSFETCGSTSYIYTTSQPHGGLDPKRYIEWSKGYKILDKRADRGSTEIEYYSIDSPKKGFS